jgi:hypothetical protein
VGINEATLPLNIPQWNFWVVDVFASLSPPLPLPITEKALKLLGL